MTVRLRVRSLHRYPVCKFDLTRAWANVNNIWNVIKKCGNDKRRLKGAGVTEKELVAVDELKSEFDPKNISKFQDKLHHFRSDTAYYRLYEGVFGTNWIFRESAVDLSKDQRRSCVIEKLIVNRFQYDWIPDYPRLLHNGLLMGVSPSFSEDDTVIASASDGFFLSVSCAQKGWTKDIYFSSLDATLGELKEGIEKEFNIKVEMQDLTIEDISIDINDEKFDAASLLFLGIAPRMTSDGTTPPAVVEVRDRRNDPRQTRSKISSREAGQSSIDPKFLFSSKPAEGKRWPGAGSPKVSSGKKWPGAGLPKGSGRGSGSSRRSGQGYDEASKRKSIIDDAGSYGLRKKLKDAGSPKVSSGKKWLGAGLPKGSGWGSGSSTRSGQGYDEAECVSKRKSIIDDTGSFGLRKKLKDAVAGSPKVSSGKKWPGAGLLKGSGRGSGSSRSFGQGYDEAERLSNRISILDNTGSCGVGKKWKDPALKSCQRSLDTPTGSTETAYEISQNSGDSLGCLI